MRPPLPEQLCDNTTRKAAKTQTASSRTNALSGSVKKIIDKDLRCQPRMALVARLAQARLMRLGRVPREHAGGNRRENDFIVPRNR